MEYSSSNSSATRPVGRIKTTKATKGHRPVEDIVILNTDPSGAVIVKFSPRAIAALEWVMAQAAQVVKGQIARNELKRGEKTLETLNASEREVKEKQMAQLRDPAATWLSAIREQTRSVLEKRVPGH